MFRSIMLRSTAATTVIKGKMPLRAISANSGKSYPLAISERLQKLGFESNLWLTEKQMSGFGVTLKEDQRSKGFETEMMDGKPFTLYNAMQTSDPKKVQDSVGKTTAIMALTGDKFYGNTQQALVSHMGSFKSNEWILDTEVTELGLSLVPNAQPVQITYHFEEAVAGEDGTVKNDVRNIVKSYYNVSQLQDASIIGRIRKIYPISCSSGKRYSFNVASKLIRTALDNNFDSPFWLSLQVAQQHGLVVKDSTAGVEIAIRDKCLTLFNASQTHNPAKVAKIAYKAQFAPRSAISGSVYPEPTQSSLTTIGLQKKFKSHYWLTEKQSVYCGVNILPGQEPAEVTMSEGTVLLYNASQTDNPMMIENRFRRK